MIAADRLSLPQFLRESHAGLYEVFCVRPGRKALLTCLRTKEPYKGLYNLWEQDRAGETALPALTGSWRRRRARACLLPLRHVMDTPYPLSPAFIKAYSGGSPGT
jgi:hypothetical protein